MVQSRRVQLACFVLCIAMQINALALPADFANAVRKRDYEMAVNLLGPLVEAGDADAMYQLAQLYRNGLGVDTDPEKARDLLFGAAHMSHLDSQYLLGLFYLKGIGGEQSIDQARLWLDRAANHGHRQASRALASLEKLPFADKVDRDKVIEAARKGNIRLLKSVSAPDLKARDTLGNTTLALALQNGHLNTATWLIKHGVPVNTANTRGDTALHLAMRARKQASVAWLLQQGADVNAANRAGKTPLHWAVEQADTDLLKQLLKSGADPLLADQAGYSALGLAQSRQADGVLAVFHQFGFEPVRKGPETVELKMGEVPALQLAVERNNLPLLKTLMKHNDDPWQANSQGHTLVTLAARYGGPEMLNYLLQQSPERAMVGPYQRNALFFAVSENSKAKLDLLLAHGVDPTQVDANGDTVVDFALETGSELGLDVLLATPVNRWQPRWLPLAAARGMQTVIRTLIDQGIALNVLDPVGHSALYYAVVHGQTDIVDALIQHGADLGIRESSGWTLLHRAAVSDEPAVLRRLLQESEVQALLEVADKRQNTALHVAANAGHLEHVKALVEAGAEINARDGNGNTPLILCVMAQEPDIMRYLLDAKADFRQRNSNKQNALGVARQLGYTELLQVLENAEKRSGLFSIFD